MNKFATLAAAAAFATLAGCAPEAPAPAPESTEVAVELNEDGTVDENSGGSHVVQDPSAGQEQIK